MAAMLLSMSLNAQAALNDGEYYVGPYTTDEYNTPDFNLYTYCGTTNDVSIGTILKPADYQQYYGDTIVGFRFALTNSTSVRALFLTALDADNNVTQLIVENKFSSAKTFNAGWNTVYLDRSNYKIFNLASSVAGLWLGMYYNQSQKYDIAVNRNSTSHTDLTYIYRRTGTYSGGYKYLDVSSELGGDVAVQLILRGEPTPVPDGYTPLPGNYADAQNINFDGIMFEDMPWGYTHYNEHPDDYTYQLFEELNDGLVGRGEHGGPRHTNSVMVPVYKTDSRVNGFYTADQIDGDEDHHLMVDVINADVDMTLEKESMIYYYTLDRDKNSLPKTRIARIQNSANNNGSYTEVSDSLYYQHNKYDVNTFARIDRWDGKNVMTGVYGQDYMSYIPIIWSWGDGTFDNKRYDWDTNGVHNSYGAPYYKTAVGAVEFNAGTDIERQDGGSYAHFWKDANDSTCCIYNVLIDAYGFLPENVSTVEFEPYKFRVWVEDLEPNDNEGLRGYDAVGDEIVPNGETPNEIVLITDDAPKCAPGTNATRLLAGKKDGDFSKWVTFGATMGFKPTLRIRFYYKVKEREPSFNDVLVADEDTLEPFVPSNGEALYYAVEDKDYAPSPHTGVIETLSGAQVVSTTFVNMQGMQSSTPFAGVNIMVTRYSDGSTTTMKVIK